MAFFGPFLLESWPFLKSERQPRTERPSTMADGCVSVSLELFFWVMTLKGSFFLYYFISASLLHSEVRQEHFLHNTPQSDRLNVILILTVAVELGDFWIGNPQTPIAGYDEDDRNTQLNIFSSKLSNKN